MKELLTGKCKEDFNKWYDVNFDIKMFEDLLAIDVQCGAFYILDIKTFNKLPLSMQYGVYLDFFDSVDLGINVTDWTENKEVIFLLSVTELGKPSQYEVKPSYNTRQEAQQQAIIKANKIYNKIH